MNKIPPPPLRASVVVQRMPATPPVFRPQAAGNPASVQAKSAAVPPPKPRLPKVPPVFVVGAAGSACGCEAVQAKAATVQMASKKKGGKAKSQGVSKGEHSWRNLLCYNKDKAKKILKDMEHDEARAIAFMQVFVKTYHSEGIRGHCSGSGEDKPSGHTIKDLEIFNSWHRQILAK